MTFPLRVYKLREPSFPALIFISRSSKSSECCFVAAASMSRCRCGWRWRPPSCGWASRTWGRGRPSPSRGCITSRRPAPAHQRYRREGKNHGEGYHIVSNHISKLYLFYLYFVSKYLFEIVQFCFCVLYILPSEKKGYCNVMYSVRNLHSNSVQSKGVKNL